VYKNNQTTYLQYRNMGDDAKMEQEYTALPLLCEILDGEGNIVNKLRLDLYNPKHRQRMAKTVWWAMHTGYEVRTRPAKGE